MRLLTTQRKVGLPGALALTVLAASALFVWGFGFAGKTARKSANARPVIAADDMASITRGQYGGGFVKDPTPPKPQPLRFPSLGQSNQIDRVLSNAYQKHQEIKNRLSVKPVVISRGLKGNYGAIIEDSTQVIHLSFASEIGGLRDVRIAERRTNRTATWFTLDQSGKLLKYQDSQLHEGASFYPSGTLEYAYWRGEDGSERGVHLSQEGHLIN